jgi:mannose-6-phosphate isomerase
VGLFPLENPIRSYAWGSHTVLADLAGRPSPTADPEAELWIGTHPVAPSRVTAGGTLPELITADPCAALGPHGDRLSFLLKVLAVERPLSLQVHPDADQARRGHAREEAAGIPLGDPRRSYHDDQPKPELICAVTPFVALCGFAVPQRSAALIADLGIDALKGVVEELGAGGLRDAVTTLLCWPAAERAELVAQARTALEGGRHPHARWAARLAAAYPGDMGSIIALLMNLVELEPGTAMYVPPRTVHAYLHGTGVEILANSDNVLRGGLTPKHIDLPELLAVTDFQAAGPQLREPEPTGDGAEVYQTPAPQFRLSRYRPDPGRKIDVISPGPGAILCLEGEITVRRGNDVLTLIPGRAVFVPHAGGPLELGGHGLAFHAVPGTDPS